MSEYEYAHRMLSYMREYINEELYESAESILGAGANCGDSYGLEFQLRNMKQDENGNLVLLDILYNVKAIR